MSEYAEDEVESDYVDPDYEGMLKLLNKLYGEKFMEDNDPDCYVYPVLQALQDMVRKKVDPGDLTVRLAAYYKAYEGCMGDPSVVNDYKDMLSDYPGNLDEVTEYVLKKEKYIRYTAFVSGLRHAPVMLDMNDDFASKYADDPDERFRAENQIAKAYITEMQAFNCGAQQCEENWYEDLIWQCEQHAAHEIIFCTDKLSAAFWLKDIEETANSLEQIEDSLYRAVQRGFAGEDLFPAIMGMYSGRYAKCTFRDGSVLRGTVRETDLPDGEWDGLFYLETEDGDVLVHAEDVKKMIPIKTLKVRVRKPKSQKA